MNGIRRIYGTHDDATVQQLERCVAVGGEAVGVLCADGHKGYSMPIGGVVAYSDYVSPSGVGYDIACGNLAVDEVAARPWPEATEVHVISAIHLSFQPTPGLCSSLRHLQPAPHCRGNPLTSVAVIRSVWLSSSREVPGNEQLRSNHTGECRKYHGSQDGPDLGRQPDRGNQLCKPLP